MRVFIDADGCPVTDLAVGLANHYQIPCTIICDTAHDIRKNGAETITVSKGADSVDFALVNMVHSGDLVITQDYGLAAMCLSKHATVVHQDGFLYTEENINGLLFFRAAAKKARQGGTRIKGPSKRKKEQDEAFIRTLDQLLKEAVK